MNKLTIILSLLVLNVHSQSKRELKEQISILETKIKEKDHDLSQLNEKVKIIGNINIKKEVSKKDFKKAIGIYSYGWELDPNPIIYKDGLISELGSIWYKGASQIYQPYGGISLTEYKIKPTKTNIEDLLYKDFVTKSTNVSGEVNVPFANLTANYSNDDKANFTISIIGTATIKPNPTDFPKIAKSLRFLSTNPNIKSIKMCTGMHIVKFSTRKYIKQEGDGKISSPFISVNGDYFFESGTEKYDYLIWRQMSEIFIPSGESQKKIEKQISRILKKTDSEKSLDKLNKYNSLELITFSLDKTPTFDELKKFESNPQEFTKSLSIEQSKKEVLQLALIKIKENANSKVFEKKM